MWFTTIFALLGLLMWAAAGALLHFRRKQLRKTGLMDRTETSPAAGAAKAAAGALVEVKGTLRCAEPIESEMAGQACAYHLSRVIREYRETDRDASGDLKTRRRSQVVASNERFAPFAVEDGSGAVEVRPEGAEVDAVEIVNRFEEDPGRRRGLTLGGVTVVLGEGEDTIGYRHVESVLPLDSPVYVLGYAKGDGEIGGAPPEEGENHFLISHRSEEQLGKNYKRDALVLALAAVGLFLGGGLFLFGGALAVGATVVAG